MQAVVSRAARSAAAVAVEAVVQAALPLSRPAAIFVGSAPLFVMAETAYIAAAVAAREAVPQSAEFAAAPAARTAVPQSHQIAKLTLSVACLSATQV